LTSDYLKQLQLTKQLEQKAKEATKNRKTAEDKLAEVEKALSLAKAMSVDLAEAEKLLAEGHAAFGKRDYPTALALLTKSQEAVVRLTHEKIAQLIGSASAILALFEDKDQEGGEIERLLTEAGKLLSEGRREDAYAKAKGSLERTRSYSVRRTAEMSSQAQKLIELAEGNGLSVKTIKPLLSKALKIQEDGDLEGTIAKVTSCLNELMGSFSKHIGERKASLEQLLEEVSVTGKDTSAVADALARSLESLSVGDVQVSLARMTEAEKATAPLLLEAVKVKLGNQEKRSEWLIGQGVNVTRYISANRKVSEMIASGDSEASLEWLRQAEKALRDIEVDFVLTKVEQLRPRLVLAGKVKVDLSGMLQKLDEVRELANGGRAAEALELVDQVSDELDDGLESFMQLAEEVERTKAMFMQARRLKIVTGPAGELVIKSRQATLDGKAAEAAKVLMEAREVLEKLIQEGCVAPILDTELMISVGWSIGALVDEESAEVDDIIADLREGDIENIAGLLAGVNERLLERISQRTAEMVSKAKAVSSTGANVIDLSRAKKKVEDAEKAMAEEEWYEAYTLAEEAVEVAGKVQRNSVSRLSAQAAALLELGKKMGCESMTLNQKMAAIGSSSPDVAGSIQTISEVIQFSKNLIKDELTRSLSAQMRSIAAARKNGVKTAGAEKLAEESSKALLTGDLEKSFKLLQGSEKDLEKTVALNNEVYDLIVNLSALLGELGLAADNKASLLLAETKRLYEGGLYDGARISAKNCYQEAEVVGADLIAPKKLQEVKDLLPLLNQMGRDTGRLSKELEEAQTELVKGRAKAALGKAREVQRKASEALAAAINAEIAQTKAALDPGNRGADAGSSALGIIEKAQGLVAEKRYADAFRAARFARNEANQILALRSTVGKELARVEEGLAEIESLGIDVKEAAEMLRQAEGYRRSGKYNISVEIARKGLHNARQQARDRITADLAKLEDSLKVDALAGKDLAALQSSTKYLVTERVEQHRYVEAKKAMELYEEGLRDLTGVREQCAASLSKLAEGLVGKPMGSPLLKDANAILVKAQQAFRDGSYRDCLELTEECRASGSSAQLVHEMAAKRLEACQLSILQGEGRRHLGSETAALLGRAEAALEEGRYLDMDRAVLGALRSHRLAAEASNRKAVAELINLLKLFPALDLGPQDIPPGARELLDMKMGDPGGVRNLGEAIGAVRAKVNEASVKKLAKIRERVQKVERAGKETATSKALLPVIERNIAEGKTEQAIVLLRDAEMLIAASAPMVQELRRLGHRFNELRKVAEGLGMSEGSYMQHYRQALRSNDVTTATHRMNDAISALQKVIVPFVPVLEATTKGDQKAALVVGNKGEAPAMELRVVESGKDEATAPLAPILWPGSSVGVPSSALPGAGTRPVKVSYRLMLSSQVITQTLDVTG
jgi:hypothetical protein